MPEGVAGHWEAAPSREDHNRCASQVEEIRNYHKNNGYADIAYNWLVCKHGGIYRGRGWGVTSAATCGGGWNSRFQSVCYMSGPTTPEFTAAAKSSFAQLLAEAQARGWHSVIGHRDACATQCPGQEVYDWLRSGGYNNVSIPEPPPTPKARGVLLRDETNGNIYLIGPGFYKQVPFNWEFELLRFAGYPYSHNTSQTNIHKALVAHGVPGFS